MRHSQASAECSELGPRRPPRRKGRRRVGRIRGSVPMCRRHRRIARQQLMWSVHCVRC